MAINDTNVQPVVRQPRLQVLFNGQPIGGALQAEVTNNNYYQADLFTAQFAFREDPNFDLNWWGSQDTILVDIQTSLDNGDTWQSQLIGEVDHIAPTLEKGVIAIDGRDLTARFIDNKTQETFQNKTASQVVEILAARRGLTADVTPTSTPVGRYYAADHDRISRNEFVRTTTEWNLLCSLAQNEGFDIWVTGTTVHFHPSVSIEGADPYDLVWQEEPFSSNSTSINLQRSLTVAKDVIVVVRSWNSAQANEITKYAPTGARQAAIISGKAQQFTVVRPNLTQQGAQDLANKLREEITKHERILTFKAPADHLLTARTIVRLQGTRSSWDASYYVDWVRRRIARQGGFTMEVKCKNHSPQSTAIATV